MAAFLNRILLYARDVPTTSAFYQRVFGMVVAADDGDGIVELASPDGGARLLIHRAAKSVKLGQVGIKLVFDVRDIDGFRQRAAELGTAFGPSHQADGYSFANAKDPDGNNVSISSRAWRHGAD